jgi:hypothetical protein
VFPVRRIPAFPRPLPLRCGAAFPLDISHYWPPFG